MSTTDPGQATSGASPNASKSRRLVALAAVVALVLGVGATVVVLYGVGAFSTQITAEPTQQPGDNPFMPPVGTDVPTSAPPGTGRPVSGELSGLYGGTLNDARCDPQRMIEFLRSSPEKAVAWAGVQGIAVTDIPRYVAELTSVILRSDVAVTNHGFRDGVATARNSVLQAGTAVLVDRFGVPRARCLCGNPLTPAQSFSRPRYEGPRWPSFAPDNITIVLPAPVVINEFLLINIINYQIFYRPVGTPGGRDRIGVAPSPPSSPSAPGPGPSVGVDPSPTDLTGSWTLRRTNTACRNFPEGCNSGPLPVEFTNCTPTQCAMERTDGVWRSPHTISSTGGAWQAQFTDLAIMCNGRQNPGQITLELTVDGSTATGRYTVSAASNPPDCDSNASASWTVTGRRS